MGRMQWYLSLLIQIWESMLLSNYSFSYLAEFYWRWSWRFCVQIHFRGKPPSPHCAHSCIWIKPLNPLGKLVVSWSNHVFLEVIFASVSLCGTMSSHRQAGQLVYLFLFPLWVQSCFQPLVGPWHVNALCSASCLARDDWEGNHRLGREVVTF